MLYSNGRRAYLCVGVTWYSSFTVALAQLLETWMISKWLLIVFIAPPARPTVANICDHVHVSQSLPLPLVHPPASTKQLRKRRMSVFWPPIWSVLSRLIWNASAPAWSSWVGLSAAWRLPERVGKRRSWRVGIWLWHESRWRCSRQWSEYTATLDCNYESADPATPPRTHLQCLLFDLSVVVVVVVDASLCIHYYWWTLCGILSPYF